MAMSSIEEQLKARRELRQLTELRIKQFASKLYDTFTDSEKTLVQFGMLPHDKAKCGEEELIMELTDNGTTEIGGGLDIRDVGRLLAVGCMDAANAGSKKMVC
jgi:hypothetical protein